MDIVSKTLVQKAVSVTGWRGESGARHKNFIKNIVVLVKYEKGAADTDIKLQIYAKSTLGGTVMDIPKSIFVAGDPADLPTKYIPSAVPISMEADGVFQFFFQVSDNEVSFAAEVTNNVGADGKLYLEIGDA